MHKNFAGTTLGFGALILLRQPRVGRLVEGMVAHRSFFLLVVAIVMTQSRQALIGLARRAHLIACFGGE